MKKVITKSWSIGLIAVLLISSLLISVASPASGADLAWSTQAIPSALTYQVLAGSNAALVRVASNGDIFAVDTVGMRVYKSTTGGRTWSRSLPVTTGTPPAAVAAIVDMEISPSYATDSTIILLAQTVAAVAGPPQAYISTNGGASFSVLGAALPAGTGTSLDISPSYSGGVGEVMIGTANAAALTYGNVYIWGTAGIQNWTVQATMGGEAVTTAIGVAMVYGGGTNDTLNVEYLNQNGVARTIALGTNATVVVTDGVGVGAFTLAAAAAGDLVRDITNVALAAAPVADDTGGSITFTSTTTLSLMGTWTFTAANAGVYADGLAISEDITDVAFSPNYPIDATVLAVGSDIVGTSVHTRVTGAAWDATIGGAVAIANTAGALFDIGNAAATNIITSHLAIPSDFNGSLPLQRTAYVAVRSQRADDRIFRFAAGSVIPAVQLQPTTLVADAEFSSLEFAGAGTTGVLIAGNADTAAVATPQVYTCANPTAVITTWAASFAPPTGGNTGGEITYAFPSPNYATDNTIYAGTVGGAASNSALSISTDGGAFFHQAGLVDSAISNIQDFQAASSNDLFLLTAEAVTNIGSLWASSDAGATWDRKWTAALTAGTGIVRVSPNYATDASAYVADLAGTNIWLTNNGGGSWSGRVSPVAIGDIAIKDQYTIYIGSSAAAQVQSTANGGWTWQPVASATGGAAVFDIEIDGSTILVGDTAGGIRISFDNVTYIPVGGAVGAGNTLVEFDNSFATNSIVYAAGTAAAGLQRFTWGTSTAWQRIENNVGGANAPALTLPRDIISAPDGTLYASDATPAANAVAPLADLGGIVRSIDSTMPIIAGVMPGFEQVSFDDGLVAGAVFGGLALAEGSNIIYAIDSIAAPAGPAIRVYTDTQAIGTPPAALTGPAEGAIIDNNLNTFNFTWDAVPGALTYQVRYATRTDFVGATVRAAVAAPLTFDVVGVGTLLNGVTYYAQVRVASPAVSPWSSAISFETQLAAAAINAPGVAVGPQEGGTAPGGWDASLTPTFQWGAIANATSYEFQLATDVGMTDLIIDATGANALGNQTSYKLTSPALDNNTTYYWRVRAISPTTNTDWSVIAAFTTLAAAPAPTPPVEIVQQPAPQITVETPPPPPDIVLPQPAATEEIAPGYIWAIIVIGAILVIAVIVLIVRTRRSV